MQRLRDFYDMMRRNRDIRKEITALYIQKDRVPDEKIRVLKENLESIKNVPNESGVYELELYEGRRINMDFTYEIDELEKDIVFLERPENEFYVFLDNYYEGFQKAVDKTAEFLDGFEINNFITDRDGTINNYCSRYLSSVQSVYNAVFLTGFAREKTKNSVILTSAPLAGPGLIELSVNPEGVFIYAGSKGREYMDKSGEKGTMEIEPEKREMLRKLNEKLIELTENPEYAIFKLIGSGLQFKFGQTTAARQDIKESISKEKSLEFLEKIKNIVKEIDPENKTFRIEDTGRDVEIILTIESEGEVKDFDKGDGVKLLNERLDLQLSSGGNLVCGDTVSDLPMVEAAVKKAPERTKAFFVTNDGSLAEKLKKICPDSTAVPCPDVLAAALYKSSKAGKK